MKITIREIAKRANVSAATVSRVLNNDEKLVITPEVRKRILNIVEETNYTKKKYKSKKSRYKIGLIRMYDKKVEIEDVYYITLRRNLENLLDAENIKYSIYDLDDNIEDFIEEMKRCDCLVTVGEAPNEQIENLYRINSNIICVDSVFNFDGVDHIRYDEKKAIDQIFNYILELKHKKVGLLSAVVRNSKDTSIDFRYTCFVEKLIENDMLVEDFILQGEMNADSGYTMMRELLNKPDRPTIVFCANDSIAIGAYKAIANRKFLIPDDISIIGFNDIKSSKYMIPSLTTLKINLDDMADCAVTLLKERIYNGRKYSKNVLLETNLIIRKSCMANT